MSLLSESSIAYVFTYRYRYSTTNFVLQPPLAATRQNGAYCAPQMALFASAPVSPTERIISLGMYVFCFFLYLPLPMVYFATLRGAGFEVQPINALIYHTLQ